MMMNVQTSLLSSETLRKNTKSRRQLFTQTNVGFAREIDSWMKRWICVQWSMSSALTYYYAATTCTNTRMISSFFCVKLFFFCEILSPQSLYSKVILIMKVFRNLHQLLLAPPGFSWPTLFPGKLGETKTNYFFRTWTWSENQLIVMNQAVVVVVEFYLQWLQSSVCCVRVRNVESNLVWQIWQAGNSAVSFALHNLVLSSCSHDLVNAIQVNFYCPIIFQL